MRLRTTLSACLVAVAYGLARVPHPAVAQAFDPGFPSADSTVMASVVAGSTLTIGGHFSLVGPVAHGGATLGPSTAAILSTVSQDGQIRVAIPDGSGGWYVGGTFQNIQGSLKRRVAHLGPDLEIIAAFNPNVDGPVRAMALSGTTLYIGGSFGSVFGQPRTRLAALDTGDGLPLAWNPGANGEVFDMELAGSNLYVAGAFTSAGGVGRNRLAALDASSGAPSAWNPNADGLVRSLAISGSTVYVGGGFTFIGDSARNRVAAVDFASSDATPWNPDANGTVTVVCPAGATVFAGGTFTTIGGQSRERIAAIDASSGAPLSWNPGADGEVETLALDGATLFAGGGFTTFGGQDHQHLGALDAASGAVLPWTSHSDRPVTTLAAAGSRLFAGGAFRLLGATRRRHLAAIDLDTKALTPWNPGADGSVFTLLREPASVFAGGAFSTIGGQARSRLAALDPVTGAAIGWDPNPTGTAPIVLSLLRDAGTLYVAGRFTSIGGAPRSNAAAVDLGTGLATSWQPDPDGTTTSFALDGSRVYVGGAFGTIGGLPRSRIAAVDPVTGAALSGWNPGADQIVWDLEWFDGMLYAGGEFLSLGGKRHFAEIDASSGTVTAWDLNVQDDVYALTRSGVTLYLGGAFDHVESGLGPSSALAIALDLSSHTRIPWSAGLNSNEEVRAIAIREPQVVLGGWFRVSEEIPPGYNVGVISTGTVDVPAPTSPWRARLAPPMPNPAHLATHIGFELARRGRVWLRLFDVGGREVFRSIDGIELEAGRHEARLDTARLPNGLYFCQLRSGAARAIARVVVAH